MAHVVRPCLAATHLSFLDLQFKHQGSSRGGWAGQLGIRLAPGAHQLPPTSAQGPARDGCRRGCGVMAAAVIPDVVCCGRILHRLGPPAS